MLEQKVKNPKAGSYLVFTKNLLLGVNCSHRCRNVLILACVPTLSHFVASGMFIILTPRHEEPLFFSCVSLFCVVYVFILAELVHFKATGKEIKRQTHIIIFSVGIKLKCNFSRPQTTKNKGASLSMFLNLFNP